MFVETLGGFIFGSHKKSEDTQLRTRRSQNGIREENSIQALGLVILCGCRNPGEPF